MSTEEAVPPTYPSAVQALLGDLAACYPEVSVDLDPGPAWWVDLTYKGKRVAIEVGAKDYPLYGFGAIDNDTLPFTGHPYSTDSREVLLGLLGDLLGHEKGAAYLKLSNHLALAQASYEAYGSFVDWKNYMGTPMPTWDMVPTKIKYAWAASLQPLRNAWRGL